MHASVYKIRVQKGDVIKAGDLLLVLEAMKMEVNIAASKEHEGLQVGGIVVGSGDIVKPGDTLLVFAIA